MLVLASPPKSSTTKDVIRFSATKPEFKDIVVKVGEQEGYDVYLAPSGDTSLDPSVRDNLYLELKKGISFGSGVLTNMTGHVKVSTIIIDSKDNGQTWNCQIYALGNFSNSSSDTALKIWKDLKTKLITSAGFPLTNELLMPTKPQENVTVQETKPQTTLPKTRKSSYPEIINVP